MKLARRFALALLLLVPAGAYAADALAGSGSSDCCDRPGCCPSCDDCPFR